MNNQNQIGYPNQFVNQQIPINRQVIYQQSSPNQQTYQNSNQLQSNQISQNNNQYSEESNQLFNSDNNKQEVDDTDLFAAIGNAAQNEMLYQQQQYQRQMQQVNNAVRYNVNMALLQQQNKMQLEVNNMLANQVDTKMIEYEKQRKRLVYKDRVFTGIKIVIVLGVVIFLAINPQTRKRISLVGQDLGEMTSGIIKGEEVHSNKLVEDLFRDLKEDLDDTKYVEFQSEETNTQVESEAQNEIQNEVQDEVKNKE